MAKEGTVAPKERVNIVYRPSREDAREEVELPLKILVLGDFTGAPGAAPVEQRAPVNIDKDNFNEVLGAQEVALNLSVPNRLGGSEELEVELRFDTMKDFGPEAIAQQIPELRSLLELREALRALKGPLANAPDFRRKIQELIQDEESRRKLIAEVGAAKEGA